MYIRVRKVLGYKAAEYMAELKNRRTPMVTRRKRNNVFKKQAFRLLWQDEDHRREMTKSRFLDEETDRPDWLYGIR